MTNPLWTLLDHRATPDHLGFIPQFLDECDGRPAAEQFNDRYAHGGGWWPMDNWEYSAEDNSITYVVSEDERDDPLPALAKTKLREETIYIYPHDWVAIVQPNGAFEISRMD